MEGVAPFKVFERILFRHHLKREHEQFCPQKSGGMEEKTDRMVI